MVLAAGGAAVEHHVAADGGTAGAVELAELRIAAAVDAGGGVVLPGDDVAAAGQCRDVRIVLLVDAGARGDAELAADGDAGAGVALGVNAGAAAVLPGRAPDHDVAAVGEHGNLRLVLRAFTVRVDGGRLAIDERGTVQALRDIDRHGAGIAAAAVAVGQADADRACALRPLRDVGIGQVLNQGLDGIGAGIGAQVDAQAAAVVAAVAGSDGADGAATERDGAAGDADLAGAGADVAHAELVLRATALHVEQVEPATGEIGRVDVHHTDGGIDDLRRGVDCVLGEADAAGEVADGRVGLARQAGCTAEDLLRDLVGVAARADDRCDVVVCVGDDEVAAGQRADRR